MNEVIRKTTPEQMGVVQSVPFEISDFEDYRNADMVSSQTPKQIDFDLRADSVETPTPDVSIARQIVQDLHRTEAEQKAEEKMGQWRLQLQTVESEEELIKIAMELSIDVLIEALLRNVKNVDKTYLAFCKSADKEPMHIESLNQIKADMKAEYEEIKPFLAIADNFKDIIGRK